MNKTLTRDLFDRYLNGRFRIEAGETRLECELIECRRLMESQPLEHGQREPFSLLFRGPREPALPQRICSVDHDELGVIGRFGSPIVVWPLPPYVVPISENRAVFCEIGRSCPLQKAQSRGAKFPANIRLSAMNGSDIN